MGSGVSERWPTIEGLTIIGNNSGSGAFQGLNTAHAKIYRNTITGYGAGCGVENKITVAGGANGEHWSIEDNHITECLYSVRCIATGAEKSFNGGYYKNNMTSNSQDNNSYGYYLDGKFENTTFIGNSHSPVKTSGNHWGWYFANSCTSLDGLTFIGNLVDEGNYNTSGTVTAVAADCAIASNTILFINQTYAGGGGGGALVPWDMGTQPYMHYDSDGKISGLDPLQTDDLIVTGEDHLFFYDEGGEYILGDGNTLYFISGGGNALQMNDSVRMFKPMALTGSLSAVTISGSQVAVTNSFHRIIPQGGVGAGTDYVTHFTGANDGDKLEICADNSSDTIIIVDGTGNINTTGDITLDNSADMLTLTYNGYIGWWVETSFSDNGS